MSTWTWKHDTDGATDIDEIWELEETDQIDSVDYPCVVRPANRKTWRIVGPNDEYNEFGKERFKTAQQAKVAAKFMYLAGVWK